MATQKIETGLIADDAVTSAKIGTLDANLEFGDSVKAVFGAGSDLQIYHSGSHSFIDEQGTGGLITRTSDFYLRNPSDADMIYATSGAAVKLYHNGSEKLATTSSGIDITGTATMDGLTVQGAAANYNTIQFTSGSTGHGTIINLGDTSDADYGSITQFATSAGEGGRMRFIAGTTETMNLRGGNVGIGNNNPTSAKLEVKGAKTQSGGAPIGNVLIADSTSLAANTGGGITFQGVYQTGGAITGFASIEAMKETATHNEYGGALVFKSRQDQGSMNERMRIDSSGNVGIGISSPAGKLHIEGTNIGATPSAQGNLLVLEDTENGLSILTSSAGAGYINFGDSDDNDVGMILYDHSANTMKFTVNAAERMRIKSDGKVGIGTSSPLDLLHLESTSGDVRQLLNAPTDSDAELKFAENGTVKYTIGHDAASDNFVIGTTNVDTEQRLVIDSSGNVGIGETSPENILHIKKAASGSSYSADGSDLVIIENSSSAAIDIRTPTGDSGGIHFSDTTRARGAIIYYHSLDDMYFNVAGTSGAMVIDSSGNVGIGTTSVFDSNTRLELKKSGNCQFFVSSSDASGVRMVSSAFGTSYGKIGTYSNHVLRFDTNDTERMRIDTSGNVGIYAVNPTTRLHVRETGATIASGNAIEGSTQKGILLENTANDSTSLGLWYSSPSGNHQAGISFQRNDHNTTWGTDMRFYTHENATVNVDYTRERCRIDSEGRFLINTTSSTSFPTNKAAAAFGAGGEVNLKLSSYGSAHTWQQFIIGGSTVGSISGTTSATSYNTSSDYRLKENVEYNFNALGRVAQLKPARFNFIADAGTTVDGFLAHEVQDIVPEAITGEKDAVDDEGNPEYQGIDQSKLVPLLTKAIQEQQTIIDDLKSRIETLEG